MSIIAHAVMGALVTSLFLPAPAGVILGALLGALPDLAGWLDGLIRGKEYRWSKGLYGKFHQPEYLWFLWFLVPPVGLHIGIDMLTHRPEGGWSTAGFVAETAFWTLIVLAVITMSVL